MSLTCTAKYGPGGPRRKPCGQPAEAHHLTRRGADWSAELCRDHLIYFTGRCGWRPVARLEIVR